jgi:hypothetical protein
MPLPPIERLLAFKALSQAPGLTADAGTAQWVRYYLGASGCLEAGE